MLPFPVEDEDAGGGGRDRFPKQICSPEWDQLCQWAGSGRQEESSEVSDLLNSIEMGPCCLALGTSRGGRAREVGLSLEVVRMAAGGQESMF